jgi:hypothetical protein
MGAEERPAHEDALQPFTDSTGEASEMVDQIDASLRQRPGLCVGSVRERWQSSGRSSHICTAGCATASTSWMRVWCQREKE